MDKKVRVITKEVGEKAKICEFEDSYQAIRTFLKGPIEYHDHPKLPVQFIVCRTAQAWDDIATVYVDGRQEVLGGNFIVAKHDEEGGIISFDEKEAEEILLDIHSRELNDPTRTIVEAIKDLRQIKKYSRGLAKGMEM